MNNKMIRKKMFLENIKRLMLCAVFLTIGAAVNSCMCNRDGDSSSDTNDISTNSYENESTSSRNVESYTFRSGQDVVTYLSRPFRSNIGDVVRIGGNRCITFNGRTVTNAVNISILSDHRAIIKAHDPINRVNYTFIVDSNDGTLEDANGGDLYYATR